MTPALLTLTACLALTQPGDKKREPHPLAPSLPLLTAKEYDAIDRIIDRFILVDTGKLKGPEATKALADFKALGPEAIPSLIDGLNRAANLEDSCPAVLIAKKLAPMLSASKDAQLLDFARDNIGAGVTGKRHTVVLKDLRLACQLRKSALQAAALNDKSAKPAKSMTTQELLTAAGGDGGLRLKQVLTELETRPGEQVLPALVAAVGHSDDDVKKHARGLLTKYVGRAPNALKTRLADERPEVRAAAARAVGTKGFLLGNQLIKLLNDPDADVSQSARQALVQLSRGKEDHGPVAGASPGEVIDSIRQWQAWWDKQTK